MCIKITHPHTVLSEGAPDITEESAKEFYSVILETLKAGKIISYLPTYLARKLHSLGQRARGRNQVEVLQN